MQEDGCRVTSSSNIACQILARYCDGKKLMLLANCTMHQLVGSFEAQQKGMNEFASRPYKHFNPKLAGLKWIHIGTRKDRGFRKKNIEGRREDEISRRP